jgi:hypothetical protein
MKRDSGKNAERILNSDLKLGFRKSLTDNADSEAGHTTKKGKQRRQRGVCS